MLLRTCSTSHHTHHRGPQQAALAGQRGSNETAEGRATWLDGSGQRGAVPPVRGWCLSEGHRTNLLRCTTGGNALQFCKRQRAQLSIPTRAHLRDFATHGRPLGREEVA